MRGKAIQIGLVVIVPQAIKIAPLPDCDKLFITYLYLYQDHKLDYILKLLHKTKGATHRISHKRKNILPFYNCWFVLFFYAVS